MRCKNRSPNLTDTQKSEEPSKQKEQKQNGNKCTTGVAHGGDAQKQVARARAALATRVFKCASAGRNYRRGAGCDKAASRAPAERLTRRRTRTLTPPSRPRATPHDARWGSMRLRYLGGDSHSAGSFSGEFSV
ncbi:hypothetical protein R5R35_007597 [Gryllus longicercus]|uniref:Uncharacterized protein n=1 Tax=Gryllus longicercus TaxID=2509291 RepID=A0AAN9W3I4_9ORTH